MKYVQLSYLNVQLGKWKNANSEVQSTESAGCSFASNFSSHLFGFVSLDNGRM
jgi:hypothetical protein